MWTYFIITLNTFKCKVMFFTSQKDQDKIKALHFIFRTRIIYTLDKARGIMSHMPWNTICQFVGEKQVLIFRYLSILLSSKEYLHNILINFNILAILNLVVKWSRNVANNLILIFLIKKKDS